MQENKPSGDCIDLRKIYDLQKKKAPIKALFFMYCCKLEFRCKMQFQVGILLPHHFYRKGGVSEKN